LLHLQRDLQQTDRSASSPTAFVSTCICRSFAGCRWASAHSDRRPAPSVAFIEPWKCGQSLGPESRWP